MPGDVLEVRILDINLILDWGYNRQRAYTGALPEEFTGVWTRIIPLNRATKAAEVAKGVVGATHGPRRRHEDRGARFGNPHVQPRGSTNPW
jgi:hypothetical protein